MKTVNYIKSSSKVIFLKANPILKDSIGFLCKNGLRKSDLGTAKGQLISKGLFKVYICTKNERKYFCIPALAYKKRSNEQSSVRESK